LGVASLLAAATRDDVLARLDSDDGEESACGREAAPCL